MASYRIKIFERPKYQYTNQADDIDTIATQESNKEEISYFEQDINKFLETKHIDEVTNISITTTDNLILCMVQYLHFDSVQDRLDYYDINTKVVNEK